MNYIAVHQCKDCNEVKSRAADFLLVTAKVLSNTDLHLDKETPSLINELKSSGLCLSCSAIVEIQDNKRMKREFPGG